MSWIIGGTIVAFIAWLVLVIIMLAREDTRIRTEPWIRPVVVRSAAVELAREAQETARLLERAAAFLDG